MGRSSLCSGLCCGEIYGTSAVIGGMVSQEAIKLITEQYVPLETPVVFDSITCRMEVIQ